MKCPKCGKEIANDSNFCEYCGTKVDTSNMNTNKFLMIIITTFGSTFLLLFPIIVFGGEYYIVGLILGLSFFVYMTIKINKNNSKEIKVIRQEIIERNIVSYAYAKRTSLESLELTPITLSPDSRFIYKGMKETVSRYIPKDPNTLITVGYDKLGGNSVTDRAVMQFYRDSDSAELDIAIYFWPPSHAMLERFERNPFFSDFKEVANDKTYNAYYGRDIDKAVKVASYILATVYYIPMDTQLEFDCDHW